jgi:hypothetical protein
MFTVRHRGEKGKKKQKNKKQKKQNKKKQKFCRQKQQFFLLTASAAMRFHSVMALKVSPRFWLGSNSGRRFFFLDNFFERN